MFPTRQKLHCAWPLQPVDYAPVVHKSPMNEINFARRISLPSVDRHIDDERSISFFLYKKQIC